jgi:hypothetical protein
LHGLNIDYEKTFSDRGSGFIDLFNLKLSIYFSGVFVLDNLQQLEQTKTNTGETNLIGAEGATTPETLRQKNRT